MLGEADQGRDGKYAISIGAAIFPEVVRISFSKTEHNYDFWIRADDSRACGASTLSYAVLNGTGPKRLTGDRIPCG